METASPSHRRLSRLREGRGEIGHPRHLQPSPLDCQNTPYPPKAGRYAVSSISPAIQWVRICASSTRRASFVAFEMAIDCFDLAEAPQHPIEVRIWSQPSAQSSKYDSGDHRRQRTAGWSHVRPREIALYSSIVGATSIQSRVQRKVGLPGHTVVISRKTCKRNIPQVRNEDLIAATIETKLAIACRLLFFHTYSRKSEPSSHVPFMHLIILITSFRCLPPKPSLHVIT